MDNDEWEDVDDSSPAQADVDWEDVDDSALQDTASSYLGRGDDVTIDVDAALLSAATPQSAGSASNPAQSSGENNVAGSGSSRKRARPSDEDRQRAAHNINLRRAHLLALISAQQHANDVCNSPELQAAVLESLPAQHVSGFRAGCDREGRPTLAALTQLQHFFAFLYPLVADVPLLQRCWRGYDPAWYAIPPTLDGQGRVRLAGAHAQTGVRLWGDYRLQSLLAIARRKELEHRVSPVQQVLLWLSLLRALGATPGGTRLVQVHDLLEPGEAREWAGIGGGSGSGRKKAAEGARGPGRPPSAPVRHKKRLTAVQLRKRIAAVNAGRSFAGAAGGTPAAGASSSRPPSRGSAGSPSPAVYDLDSGEEGGDGDDADGLASALGGSGSGAGGTTRVMEGGAPGTVLDRSSATPSASRPAVWQSTIGSLGKVSSRTARGLPGLKMWVEVLCQGQGEEGRWVHSDPARQSVDTPGMYEPCRPVTSPVAYALAVTGHGQVVDVTPRYTRKAGMVLQARDAEGMHGSALGSLAAFAFLAPAQAIRARRAGVKAMTRASSTGGTGGGGGTGGAVDRVSARVLDHASTKNEEATVSSVLSAVLGSSGDPPRVTGLTWLAHALLACSGGGAGQGREGVGAGSGSGSGEGQVTASAPSGPSGAGASSSSSFSALPTREADFKAHPHYALEKHCSRYEVIWPRTGQVSYFKGAPVWPRSHVQALYSRSGWHRREGMVVAIGEVGKPVRVLPKEEVEAERKRRAAARARGRGRGGRGGGGFFPGRGGARMDLGPGVHTHDSPSHLQASGEERVQGEEEEEESSSVAADGSMPLYGRWQCTPYSPPALTVHDPIPVHPVYGTFQLWHPAWLNPGLTHVRHAQGKKAAVLLGVPYAPAFLGFSASSSSTSTTSAGIVVHACHAPAVLEVAQGIEGDREEKAARKAEALEREAAAKEAHAAAVRARLRAEYGDEAMGLANGPPAPAPATTSAAAPPSSATTATAAPAAPAAPAVRPAPAPSRARRVIPDDEEGEEEEGVQGGAAGGGGRPATSSAGKEEGKGAAGDDRSVTSDDYVVLED